MEEAAGNAPKRVRRNHADDELDRISNLPDDIIHHIFSFFDAKFAVGTSALSKRWKPIWLSLPYLNLDSNHYAQNSDFNKAAHQLFDNLHCRTISLGYSGKVGSELMKRLTEYAKVRQTEKVEIFCNEGEFSLSIFDCPALKQLSLKADVTVSNFKQSPWNLPALTTLHLENVSFRQSNNLDLFSKLVSLVNLTLQDCYNEFSRTFKIISLTLENLAILYHKPLDTILLWACTKRLQLISEFEMITPNLSSLAYKNHFLINISPTSRVDSLKKVTIDIILIEKASPLNQARLRKLDIVQESRKLINQLGKGKFFSLRFTRNKVDVMAMILEKTDLHGWLKVVHTERGVIMDNGPDIEIESFLTCEPRASKQIFIYPEATY